MMIVLSDPTIQITNFEFEPYQKEMIKAIMRRETVVILHARRTGRVSFVKKLKACPIDGIFPIIAPSLPNIEALNERLLMFKNFGANNNIQNTYGWYRKFEKKRF